MIMRLVYFGCLILCICSTCQPETRDQSWNKPNKAQTLSTVRWGRQRLRASILPGQGGQMRGFHWDLSVRSRPRCVVWHLLSALAKHLIEQTAAVTEVPQGAALIPPTGTASPFISPVSLPLYLVTLTSSDVCHCPKLTFNHDLRFLLLFETALRTCTIKNERRGCKSFWDSSVWDESLIELPVWQ